MATKREVPDFSSLLSPKGAAVPPPQAIQRSPETARVAPEPEAAKPALTPSTRGSRGAKTAKAGSRVHNTPSEELVSLAFRVPKEFRREFQRHAFDADLKYNAFLVELLENWKRQKKSH